MDTLTRRKRSELMSRIRSKRTGPEMLFHGILKGNGVEHQMWPESLPGHPDCVVYGGTGEGSKDVCVFVHGCFWHGCPRHYRQPRSNAKFWQNKILRNIARHTASAAQLRRMGYGVLVVWEHDVRAGASRVVRRVKKS